MKSALVDESGRDLDLSSHPGERRGLQRLSSCQAGVHLMPEADLRLAPVPAEIYLPAFLERREIHQAGLDAPHQYPFALHLSHLILDEFDRLLQMASVLLQVPARLAATVAANSLLDGSYRSPKTLRSLVQRRNRLEGLLQPGDQLVCFFQRKVGRIHGRFVTSYRSACAGVMGSDACPPPQYMLCC